MKARYLWVLLAVSFASYAADENFTPGADEAVRAHFPYFKTNRPEFLTMSTLQLLEWVSKRGATGEENWGSDALSILEARAAKRAEDELWSAQAQLFGWLTSKKSAARRENVRKVLGELFKNPAFISRPLPPLIQPALRNILMQEASGDGTFDYVQEQVIRLLPALEKRDPEFVTKTLVLALKCKNNMARLLAVEEMVNLGLNEKTTEAVEDAIARETRPGFAISMIMRLINANPGSLDIKAAHVRKPAIYNALFRILAYADHVEQRAQAAEILGYLAMIQDPTAEEKGLMKKALTEIRAREQTDRGYVQKDLERGRSVPAAIAGSYESATILLSAALGEPSGVKQETWEFFRRHEAAAQSKETHEPRRSVPRD